MLFHSSLFSSKSCCVCLASLICLCSPKNYCACVPQKKHKIWFSLIVKRLETLLLLLLTKQKGDCDTKYEQQLKMLFWTFLCQCFPKMLSKKNPSKKCFPKKCFPKKCFPKTFGISFPQAYTS